MHLNTTASCLDLSLHHIILFIDTLIMPIYLLALLRGIRVIMTSFVCSGSVVDPKMRFLHEIMNCGYEFSQDLEQSNLTEMNVRFTCLIPLLERSLL